MVVILIHSFVHLSSPIHSAGSSASVSADVPGVLKAPVHKVVAYGGAGFGSGPVANILCGSLSNFKNSNQASSFGCPSNAQIPVNSAVTYRVLYDSQFSSQPEGFRMRKSCHSAIIDERDGDTPPYTCIHPFIQ